MKFSEVLGNIDLNYFQHLKRCLREPSSDSYHESFVADPAFSTTWVLRWPKRNHGIALNPVGATKVTEWHTDGPLNRAVFVWSDTYPTEIRYPSGRIVTAEPGDVVLFDNHKVKHRVPQAYIRDVQRGTAAPRHFARIQLQHEPSRAQIDKWKEHLACQMTPAT